MPYPCDRVCCGIMICLSKQLLHVLNTRHKQQEDKQIEKMRRLVVHLNEHIFGQKYLLERKEWYRYALSSTDIDTDIIRILISQYL
jgi:hypothetical protein